MLEALGTLMIAILISVVLFWIIWVSVKAWQVGDNYAELKTRISMLENFAMTSKPQTKIKVKGRLV